MRELTPKFEIENRPAHLEYSAVPLDAWKVPYPDNSGETYLTGSIDHIDDKVQEAVAEAVMNGVLNAETAPELAEFMANSLFDSQTYRIDLNRHNEPASLLDQTDDRVQRALYGLATPDELLGILADNPKLGSLELAKLSHPLHSLDSLPMDVAVGTSLIDRGAELLHEPGRYKVKQPDYDIPAVIVLRKQAMANYETENGPIQIVQRKTFLVHGDAGASNDPYLARIIRNPERKQELIEKIDGCYEYLDELPNLRWLHAQATTYYAKYLPEAAPESER